MNVSRRFVVSIDTEEDIWGWASRDPITCTNVRELPRLVRFFGRLGIRPTFFVAYQVLLDPSAREVIKEISEEDGVEIGCHVHPWNTPPYDDSPRRTMLYNLPRKVQASKIATATKLFEDALQRHPSSFRAGRFGFGSVTAACLIEQGYRVDSSVTPFFDWSTSSEGQNYIGAPLQIYRLNPDSGMFRMDPGGSLVEVPLTSGYTRFSPDSWLWGAEFLDHRVVRAAKIGAIGAWGLAFRKTILSPESHTVPDMVALARRVLDSGVNHLNLFFHSSSLVPGLTPFTPTSAAVEGLYDRVEEVLERLHRWYEFEFASITEAADHTSPEAAGRTTHATVSANASVPPRPTHRASPGRARGESYRWPGPHGTRFHLVYLARYAYWRLGGYRRFRHIRWSEVKRLVFVCKGNICRSPYAEHLATAQGLAAVSLGVDTRAGGVADPMALEVARSRGVGMDEHRTTSLKDFLLEGGDLFIAMEPYQAAVIEQRRWKKPHQVTLLGLWSSMGGAVIPDPYGGDEARFHQCFSNIERGIARIHRRLEVEAPVGRHPRTMPSSHAAS